MIDDYLFVTTNPGRARKFLRVMQDGMRFPLFSWYSESIEIPLRPSGVWLFYLKRQDLDQFRDRRSDVVRRTRKQRWNFIPCHRSPVTEDFMSISLPVVRLPNQHVWPVNYYRLRSIPWELYVTWNYWPWRVVATCHFRSSGFSHRRDWPACRCHFCPEIDAVSLAYPVLLLSGNWLDGRFAKSKSHIIFNDSVLNPRSVVLKNIYQNFLLCAMKMHHYLQDWGPEMTKSSAFILSTCQYFPVYCPPS